MTVMAQEQSQFRSMTAGRRGWNESSQNQGSGGDSKVSRARKQMMEYQTRNCCGSLLRGGRVKLSREDLPLSRVGHDD